MINLKTYNSIIPSNISCVGKTVSDILKSLEKAYGPIDDDIVFELKVVLNELLLNAIRHGNRERIDRYVKVAAGVARMKYAFFVIEDEGQGYDYKCIMDDNKGASAMNDLCFIKETGRGVLIVKNLCDKLRFNKKGNKIVVIKMLSKE